MKSAIIVAYREKGFVEENLRFLMDRGFEIVLAVDEPSDDLLRLIEEYGVKATLSDDRRGKWRALNDAIELTNGDYILFLDSDTKIVDLSFDNFDVVEIRKEVVGKSLMERLANIDYFVMFLSSKFASKFNSYLSMNGSAFMIKRDVILKLGGFRRRINEDTDLGFRLGLNGYGVKICGRAITKAPSSFRGWLSQRERWGLGGAEIIIENFGKILRKVWVPYLFMFYPTILGLLIYAALPNSIVLKILYLILPLLTFIPVKFLSFALLTLFSVHTIKNLFSVLFPFTVWTSVIVIMSKREKYKIDYTLLPIYYFLYSPLWTMICLSCFFRVLLARFMGKDLRVKDWFV
ncbi:MAG: glycosyltransferase family 2 protein [Archaeoglobales archaeon]|nr:MAG: glycosyltransferase family 2 protein [Archaeoglobales archaeon]